ncbi:MAG: LamG-like jellyroll fold domain-containing protein [Bacteroidia bacterium]
MKKNIIKKVVVAAFAIAFMHQISQAQSTVGLNFDGTDDRCTINDNAAYNLGTGNFTFEAWVKAFAPQSNSYPGIFYRKNGNGLAIFLDPLGRLSFNLAGASLYCGTAVINDNVCHHIAVVRSSLSAITIYIDGVSKCTASGFNYGSISTTSAITIGYADAFKGLIHEVRFWNVARTQTEIQNSKNIFLAGNETGLIGYWRMNEGIGQTINDLSPTNNDGFLGTVNTSDAADPLFVSNSCMCPNPVITSTGGAVCAGQNPTLSTALVSGYTYQWRVNASNIPGATSNTHVATAAGNYQCQATAFGCSAFSNGINLISGAPTAAITAGGPTTFCTPNSVGLGANTGTLLTYQWKLNGTNIAGATLSGYSAFTAGNYSCVVANNCGSSTSNVIIVTVNQTPTSTISAGGPTLFCTGGSVTLTANSGTGYTFQWKKNGTAITGATSQSYAANQSGSYTVSVTSGSCTGNSGAISVTVEQALTPTITENIIWFCPSTTVGLEVQQPVGGASNYQWFEDTHTLPGANNYELIVGHNGNYKCSITNSCGTFYTPLLALNDFILSIAPRGTISANGSLNLCTTGSVTLSVDQIWQFSFSNFQWFKDGIIIPTANFNVFDATQTGSYLCRMTDNDCGQTYYSNSITFTVNSPPSATITPGGPTTFCSGGSVTLNVPAGANKTYQWQKGGVSISGANSSSYVATNGGNYKVTVTNTVTGCSKTTAGATVVTVNSLPSATISPQGPTTFCAGGSVVLKGNNGTGLTYKWKKGGSNIAGATSKNYTATLAGTYKVKVTNANGCTKLSSGVTVTVPCREENENAAESVFDIKVYPNPSSGDFVFELSNSINEKISIVVYDVIGNKILTESVTTQKFTICGNQLSTGIYMAHISTGNYTKILKLIKSNP